MHLIMVAQPYENENNMLKFHYSLLPMPKIIEIG